MNTEWERVKSIDFIQNCLEDDQKLLIKLLQELDYIYNSNQVLYKDRKDLDKSKQDPYNDQVNKN